MYNLCHATEALHWKLRSQLPVADLSQQTFKRFVAIWGNCWGLKFANHLVFLHRHLSRFKLKLLWKTGRISYYRVCSLSKIVPVSHTSSYNFCKIKTLSKLAGCFRPKVEMQKYSLEVSMIVFVDIECIDNWWIFDCQISSFLNNRAREPRFL